MQAYIVDHARIAPQTQLPQKDFIIWKKASLLKQLLNVQSPTFTKNANAVFSAQCPWIVDLVKPLNVVQWSIFIQNSHSKFASALFTMTVGYTKGRGKK